MTSFLSQIVEETLSYESKYSNLKFESVVIGIRYTCVLLSNGSCGVAYTLIDNKAKKESQKKYLSEKFISEQDLPTVMNYCTSKFSIFRSIGIAALNAFSQANLIIDKTQENELFSIFSEKSGTVGMIGDIRPITQFFVQKGFNIKLLDKSSSPSDNPQITSIDNILELKNCNHVIVSGSALVFENFDLIRDILPTIQGERVLIGPSAQIFPKIAFKHGFTFIGSSRIIDTTSTVRAIMEGGGYRAFKEFTQKYSFRDI